MKRLQIVSGWAVVIALAVAFALAICGCATKTRNVELSGLYVSGNGTAALGSVDIMAAPDGATAATVKFEKDYNYFQSKANYSVKVQMTGSNAVERVTEVVDSMCKAFVETAADLAAVEAGASTTNTTVVTNAMDKIVIDPSPAPAAN